MGILESDAVVAVRRPIDLAATGICWVGYGAVRAGSKRFARQLFLLALTLSPRHAVALRWLAWCLCETGDLSGAIPYYRELLRLDPSFVDGRRHSEVEPLVPAILERDQSFFERHAEWAELRTLRKLDDEAGRCGPNRE